MKQRYIEIMDKALSAYTPERIREYVDEVRRDGLTEHGFPRLGANIGILMSHGRRQGLKDTFIEIIDLCLDGFAHPINGSKAGNNFAIREVCCALMELEKTDIISAEQLKKWKEKIAHLDISTVYTHIVSADNPTPANWAYFAVLSEQARGLLCGIDATEFVEHQLPSQLLRLDQNGMYHDGSITGPYQPMLYDMMTRVLLGLSLHFGYRGKYAQNIEKMMEASDEITLKTQSVTGELPFGGRSNQTLFNETVLASYFELRASLLGKKCDPRAGAFKAAAEKAQKAALWWLDQKPMSHIKNHFDPDLKLGCEGYAYFNKYMITVASNAYLAYLAADDSITPTETVAEIGGYIAETSEDFHKVVMNAGGYFIEIDCHADTHYDASGLGRVHKKNCDSRVCLSVPFPCAEANYKLETPNAAPMSICGFKNTPDGLVTAASGGAKHVLKAKVEGDEQVSATFDCILEDELLFTATYTVNEKGVDLEFDGADGVMLPAFLFDGKGFTEITAENGSITVKYNGSFCKYTFFGEPKEHGVFFNRNGRYRVYRVATDKVHIEMGDINEI